MWTRWLPWRTLLSRVARSLGFIDPVPVLERLEKLAQPSEVTAPIELLRAGARFHARGLVNARVIQYNLDWVWPFWVQRQYDPLDEAFLPRAFAFTHVNLTHRNWTAVGVPGVDRHPLVDPRGLVTPLYDGWSLDWWLIADDGGALLPSRMGGVEQELVMGPAAGAGLEVRTRAESGVGRLATRADVVLDGGPNLRLRVRGETGGGGRLVLALRPANPEGVASVERVERIAADALRVDGQTDVCFDRPPESVMFSSYAGGDVLSRLIEPPAGGTSGGAGPDSVRCPVGLATAAAVFPLGESGTGDVSIRIPLTRGSSSEPGAEVEERLAGGAPPSPSSISLAREAWGEALEGAAVLRTCDERFRFLYDAAVRSLVLHSPGDAYPGPYTYKRFWFRDAAFIVDALCSIGLAGRAREVVGRYPGRQEESGYFRSQEGEWDANGAALWAMERYLRLTGERAPEPWIQVVRKAADWIVRKRTPEGDAPHAGLLPAGFSAEHLGPNDFYYWDDFWSAAGLRAAGRILDRAEPDPPAHPGWNDEASDLLEAVDRSILRSPGHRSRGGVPASPYRSLDAGAIGSLAASYPLRLWSPGDERLLATVEHLLDRHTVDGGFFQEMIHAGINPYLTLHVAQVLLRAGDARYQGLVRTVAALASPTGQWPEAVHPRTRGGTMGDGQHVWASAEWVLMMRNWFVREEGEGLILGSGIPLDWVRTDQAVGFGPAPTPHGPVSVRVVDEGPATRVEWDAHWRSERPSVEVRLPGHAPAVPEPGERSVRVVRSEARSRDGAR